MHPELGTTEAASVAVVTDGPEQGRTTSAAAGAPAHYVRSADGRAAKVELLEGLAGAPVPAIQESPDLVMDPTTCSIDRPDLRSGPRVIQLDPADKSHLVAIGDMDPGHDEADIEAALANPTDQGPAWFTLDAILGASTSDGPALGLVDLERGEYTVVCVHDGDNMAPELLGTTTILVTPS